MFPTSPAIPQRAPSKRSPQLWVWLVLGLLSVGITATVAVPTPMSAGDESVDNILLDFSATWCGPCQQMHPIVKRLEREGLPIRQVDVDRNPGLAQRFNVTSIPAFVLVSNGREADRVVGQVSENRLRQMIAKLPATRGTRDEAPGNGFAVLGAPQPIPRIPRQPTEPPQFQPEPPEQGIVQQVPFPVPGSPEFRAQNPEVAAASGDSMPSTVRLRVRDSGGQNYGTGTIIDSRPGQTLVLTCGHLFRQASTGQQVGVEVDLFPRGGKVETLVGQVVAYDLEADVGLVSVPSQQPLPATPLASPRKPLQVGESLVSIGCSKGDDPTRQAVKSTALNKFQGPDNIECTGLPVQGRSGGGLFRENGELVGICILADDKAGRGIYAALNPVYALLQKQNLAHLIPRGAAESESAPAAPGIEIAQNPPSAVLPQESPLTNDPVAEALLRGATSSSGASAGPSLAEARDAEVICIVRPKDPLLPSRVIIVNEASPRLLNYLLDDSGSSMAHSAKPPVDIRVVKTTQDGQ
jgi:thiol-disulfide isomerase/thioredoxin